MFKYLFSTFKLLFIITLILVSCSKKNSDFNDSETENITENPSEITKPNILLVIADDMGLDASPGYEIGSIKPYMPNLEKLAANGITFNNVWSNPTCTPTRSSILTGKYGVRTNMLKVGDVLSTSETSIQKYLANNLGSTYSHAVIGKWHLSTDPNHPTNMGVGYYAGLLTGAVSSYWDWNLTENSQTTTSTEYATTKITDLAIDWVENQTNPWFLWVAYSAPHTPFHLPPTNLHSQGNLPSDEASIVTNPLPYYMAMLEAMDSEMGRLMNSLSQEEKENTVIIFIGDNGTPQQVAQEYNSSRTKGSLYQGGINVPMIISGKNVMRINEAENALINTTDLFTTIANIAGINVDKINDSQSFYESFSNSSFQGREYAYAENYLNATIRNSTHKYILFSDGSEKLYNLIEDPLETKNLVQQSNLPLSDSNEIIKNELIGKLQEIKQ